MAVVEVDLPLGREAEQFNTALYRFLEENLRSITDDQTIVLESFPHGAVERKRVTLWSAAAAKEFCAFWRRFASDDRRTSPSTPIAAEAGA
jgi:hypothetical protein